MDELELIPQSGEHSEHKFRDHMYKGKEETCWRTENKETNNNVVWVRKVTELRVDRTPGLKPAWSSILLTLSPTPREPITGFQVLTYL